MSARVLRALLAPMLAAGLSLVPADVVGAVAPVAPVAPAAVDDSTPDLGTNPFLPDNENVGDCVSSLPRPDCGSDAHGGAGQAITFALLMIGMALIGWRIAHAVRRRDRAREQQVPDVGATDGSDLPR